MLSRIESNDQYDRASNNNITTTETTMMTTIIMTWISTTSPTRHNQSNYTINTSATTTALMISTNTIFNRKSYFNLNWLFLIIIPVAIIAIFGIVSLYHFCNHRDAARGPSTLPVSSSIGSSNVLRKTVKTQSILNRQSSSRQRRRRNNNNNKPDKSASLSPSSSSSPSVVRGLRANATNRKSINKLPNRNQCNPQIAPINVGQSPAKTKTKQAISIAPEIAALARENNMTPTSMRTVISRLGQSSVQVITTAIFTTNPNEFINNNNNNKNKNNNNTKINKNKVEKNKTKPKKQKKPIKKKKKKINPISDQINPNQNRKFVGKPAPKPSLPRPPPPPVDKLFGRLDRTIQLELKLAEPNASDLPLDISLSTLHETQTKLPIVGVSATQKIFPQCTGAKQVFKPQPRRRRRREQQTLQPPPQQQPKQQQKQQPPQQLAQQLQLRPQKPQSYYQKLQNSKLLFLAAKRTTSSAGGSHRRKNMPKPVYHQKKAKSKVKLNNPVTDITNNNNNNNNNN